jgi:beta-glucosidase
MDHPQTLDLPLYSIEHDQLALRVEQEGIVLLKNDRNVLPLDSNKTCTIAVIGPNAFPSVTGGGGSSLVTPFKADSILTGLYDYLSVHGPNSPGCNAKVLYDSGMPNHAEIFDHKTFDHGMQQSIFNKGDWSGIPAASTIDFMSDEVHTTVQKGISARWEGTFTAPQSGQYYIAVASKSGDGYSVLVNGKKVSWELSNQADSVRYFPANLLAGQMASVQINLVPTGTDLAVGVAMRSERDLFSEHALQIAKTADAVVCAVGYNREIEREGMDRSFTLPWPQNKLIREIASTNKNTIVTINSGGNVDMNSWIDNIPALLQLWYPGQAGGAALASILFGEVSPTGKLPVTFEKQWADNPVYSSYYLSATGENSIRSVKYSEGVFVGYRAFAGSNIHPQFPFGYGLSYSSFALSNLQLDRSTMFSQDQLGISVDIENIGKRRSAEVVQVYVGDPSAKVHRPVKELKSFAKVWLEPGETRTVKFTLDPRAFSYWDEKQEKWIIDPGNFEIYVGSSSEDTPLHSTFTVQ